MKMSFTGDVGGVASAVLAATAGRDGSATLKAVANSRLPVVSVCAIF